MVDTAALQDRIAQLFSDTLGFDVPSVDTDLFDTGAMDSLTFVELIVLLERDFGVKTSVDDMETENFRSIARIARFVMTHAPLPPSAADREPRIARFGSAR